MTEPTTPQGDTPLLWTDDEIYDEINKAAFTAMHKDRIGRFVSDIIAAETAINARDAARAADRQEIAELKELIEDYKLVRENCMAEIAALRAQADGGEWKPLADEEMRRISTLWGHVLMAIDLTLEHGPYAVCRRVSEER